MTMSDAAAQRARDPRRADDTRPEPAPTSGAMGIAKTTTPSRRRDKARQRISPVTMTAVFAPRAEARLRGKENPRREKENPIKAKEKGIKEEESKEAAGPPDQGRPHTQPPS